LFDDANAQDPTTELFDDNPISKELLYAQRMSRQLALYNPSASEHLKLAAQAQHIERWTSPRKSYKEGRSGYKKWRTELRQFHARRAGELMPQAGYKIEAIERVQFLIPKKQLRNNSETQCLEDVIC
jgi:hypothetical protein